jgi:metallo-beta-lactamase class B
MPRRLALAALLAASPLPLIAQSPDTAAARRSVPSCDGEREWNTPHAPFRLHGSTYYVGTHCLAALLVTSPAGHVLVDAGLPSTAPLVRASIEALGFRMADVKLIVNSHAHHDHAGGIAELQRASGAMVAASPWSARVLEAGRTLPDDPQHDIAPALPRARRVRVLADGETVRVGPLALTAHWTPGHTPGGTTWTWRSCEGARCLDVVYADSQTPISADGFSFTRGTTYPAALRDFARGHATLERLRCDLLVTPHPSASALWERMAARDAGGTGGSGTGGTGGAGPSLVDAEGCRRYAAGARAALARRVATERASP